jgi:hypothetical protein
MRRWWYFTAILVVVVLAVAAAGNHPRIGQEQPPWACNERNIYVAFEFIRPIRNAGAMDADDSDQLKAVTIRRWNEGCL